MNMCRTGNQNKGDSGADIPCLNDHLLGVVCVCADRGTTFIILDSMAHPGESQAPSVY